METDSARPASTDVHRAPTDFQTGVCLANRTLSSKMVSAHVQMALDSTRTETVIKSLATSAASLAQDLLTPTVYLADRTHFLQETTHAPAIPASTSTETETASAVQTPV